MTVNEIIQSISKTLNPSLKENSELKKEVETRYLDFVRIRLNDN